MISVGAEVLEVKIFFGNIYRLLRKKYATKKALSAAVALPHVSANQERDHK